MANKITFSKKDINYICESYKEGKTITSLKKEFSCSNSPIQRVLRENNLGGSGNKKRFSSKDKEAICKKYNEGLSVRDISKIFNCSYTPIKRILEENNIDIIPDYNSYNFSKTEVEDICKNYKKGKPLSYFQKMFSCSRSPIKRVLKENGIKIRKTKNIIPKSEYKNIIDKYIKGFSATKIADIYDCDCSVIYNILKKENINIRSNKINSRKYNYNISYFNKIDTEEKAYWLGFIYADGYLGVQEYGKRLGIALSIVDINHLEKFKSAIGATYPIKIYKPTESSYSNKEFCRIEIFGEKIYKLMNKHGVIENKTDILKAPKIDSKFKTAFIRGYFDGDGSLTESKTSYSTETKAYTIKIVGTISVLNYIKSFVEENNIAKINQYYKRREDNEAYRLEFGGNLQAESFMNKIYEDASVYLNRKYKTYIKLKKQNKKLHATKMSSLKETSGVKPL